MKIIHILPKINDGGGIGNIFAEVSALREFQVEMEVTIVSLETAFSMKRMLDARRLGIRLIIAPQIETLQILLLSADLVIVSYWNHPLLTGFLIRWRLQGFQIPLVLNVRINGLTLPQALPKWVVQSASGILYSHPNTLSEQKKDLLPDILLYTQPFINLPEIENPSKRDFFGKFVAFYAGSLNRFKRLPNLFDLHDGIELPNGRIEYWGAGEDPETTNRLSQLKFGEYRGFSKNIYADFSNYHLLLNPQSHLSYGSYEKIRVECAWMGIPCLVLKESYIATHVESGINGVVAEDEIEYAENLRQLAINPKVWKSLSESTFSHIRETYKLKELAESTIDFYQKVCSVGSRTIENDSFLPLTPLDQVLSGMGNWAEQLKLHPEKLSTLELNYALHCEGGLIHYANMGASDSELLHLIDRLFQLLENR